MRSRLRPKRGTPHADRCGARQRLRLRQPEWRRGLQEVYRGGVTTGRVDILLASADADVVETAQPVLEAAGYRVMTVDNGADVLQFTGDARVDLYLLDHNLPEMAGLRVARHLRQSYRVPRERIILLYPA